MQNFTIIETILRDRADFFAALRDSLLIGRKIRAMLISCVVFLAIYGAVMGASSGPMQARS